MSQATRSHRETLPRDPGAVALARRAVEANIPALAAEELDTARLLVSELVTNALRHGEGEILLTMDVGRRRVRFAVRDDGTQRPLRQAAPGATGGFGLNLVETLASRWGSSREIGVWFELDRAPTPGGRLVDEAAGPLEAVRSVLAPPRWSAWSARGCALAVVLMMLDVALGQATLLTALLVLPPLACALLARWADTAAVGALSLLLALLSVAFADEAASAEIAALLVVAIGGALAVLVTLLRGAAEVNLRRFRLLSAVADVGNQAASLDDAVARLLDMLTPAFADGSLLVSDGSLAGAERCLGVRPREGEAEIEAAVRTGPPGAAIVVRLRARGREVGTLTTVLRGARARRGYSPSDVTFAEVFAGRAAVVLDNAGLSRELDAAERQLGAVLDGLAEAVTVMDATGRAVYANEAAVDLLRLDSARDLLDAEPGVTMQRFDVYDEDGAPVDLRRLPAYRVLAGERDPEPLLVRNVVKATGEERWLLNKTTAVTDGDGRVVRVANVIEDVTAVKRSELAQRLLAEAGEALASSLDYERTLQRVAEVAVPALADWCGVDLPGSGGLVQPVAVAHVDPDKVALARRLRARYPLRLDEPEGLPAVMRGGPSIVIGQIPDADLVAYAHDEEHLEMLRATGMASLMIVGLTAGGQTLGALTLARTTPGRVFDDADVRLAEELARRAGMAVLNARVHTQRSAIAATLQRGLRPPELQAPPGFEIATHYSPVGSQNEVGGDFYDAFTTDDGWMLAIGDVAGHGAEAAALTALARYTLRSAGQLTRDPGRAGRQLNATLRDLPQLSLCTAVCAHLRRDPAERALLTLANCGHPRPLLLRDGRVREVGDVGPIAGAFDEGEWACTEVELLPGDVLVLYTDGVLDTVGAEDRFGEQRLHATLEATPAADPVALLAALAAALADYQRGPQRDDTAAVALRFAGRA